MLSTFFKSPSEKNDIYIATESFLKAFRENSHKNYIFSQNEIQRQKAFQVILYKCSVEELEKIILHLLDHGMAVDFVHHYMRGRQTLMQIAVEYGLLDLLTKLFDKGLDPLFLPPLYEKYAKKYKEKYQLDPNSYSVKYEYYFSDNKTPLQIINEKFIHFSQEKYLKIWQFLFEKIYSAEEKYLLQEDINCLFISIYKRLSKAFTEAKNNNKKLLVLAGECHSDISAMLLEFLILLALNELDIKTLLTEQDESIQSYLRQNKKYPTHHMWMVGMEIELLCLELGITTIPIDLAHYTNDMLQRNKVMVEELNKRTSKDVAVIVGIDHLEGFLEDNTIAADFAVITFNVSQSLYSEDNSEKHYALKSNKVIQLYSEINFDVNLIPPTVIATLAKNSLENFKQKNLLDYTIEETDITSALTFS